MFCARLRCSPACGAALFLLLLGCSDAETFPPEASFEAQLVAVRAGLSDRIWLERTEVSDEQLADLADGPGLEHLQRVNLAKGQFSDAGLAHLAALPRLRQLRFHSPHVTDEGMKHVGQMKALKFLHVMWVPITDAGLTELAGMTWLESFYLDGGEATDQGLAALLKALPRLHFHKDQQHLPEDPQAHPH